MRMSKKSPVPAAVPQTAGLAILWKFPLSPETAADVEAYHRDGIGWEQGDDELQASRVALVEGATDATLGDLIEHGREQEKIRRQLESVLVELRWRRFYLLPQLLPDAERAVADAKAGFEQVEAARMQEWIDRGALQGLPGGDTDTGRHQLRYKLNQNDLDVIAAKGRLNSAEGELESLRAVMLNAPRASQCKVEWEPTGNSLVESILSHVAEPTAEVALSFEAEPIRALVGLQGAPLLPEHVDTLHRIVETMGIPKGGTGFVTKMRGLPRHLAERVIPLLEKLPATHARNQAVREATAWAKDGHRMDPATTHYVDEQKSGFRQTAEAVG
jgi:hypothetical protein